MLTIFVLVYPMSLNWVWDEGSWGHHGQYEKMAEENDRTCWVNEVDKIISFHAIPDYERHQFDTRDLLFHFVMVTKGGQGYRVQ